MTERITSMLVLLYVNPVAPAEFLRGSQVVVAVIFAALAVAVFVVLRTVRRARRRGDAQNVRLMPVLWVVAVGFLVAACGQVAALVLAP